VPDLIDKASLFSSHPCSVVIILYSRTRVASTFSDGLMQSISVTNVWTYWR